MNALDRQAAQIIAAYLHDEDPRFVWEPRPATAPAQRSGRSASAAPADHGHRATPREGDRRHAA
jgi:hypothetical protein